LNESHWPQTNLTPANKVIPEVAFNMFSVSQYEPKVEKDLWAMHMTTKLEHWDKKLCRIAHFIKTGRALLEYHHNGRTASPTLKDGIPGAAELQDAETMLVREIQAKHFPEEIKILLKLNIRDPEARPELRKQNSCLVTLNPFMDEQGVLCAGGRLELSELRSFESKHPAILPSHEEAVEALIRKEHNLQLHAGINHTLAALRRKFFIMGGRTTIG
jgi:hypothetical protein